MQAVEDIEMIGQRRFPAPTFGLMEKAFGVEHEDFLPGKGVDVILQNNLHIGGDVGLLRDPKDGFVIHRQAFGPTLRDDPITEAVMFA